MTFGVAPEDHSLLAAWYEPENPEVSIIVLMHNGSDLTADCLSAIWRTTSGYKYEIVVVDNGSDQTHLSRLRQIAGHFRLICLPQNRPFGEANNIAAGSTNAPVVVFLNNDTIVQEDWLRPLMSLLASSERIGAVGPKMLFPNGRLQEAGAYVEESGIPLQIGNREPYHPEEIETARIVDYCSAACLAVRRPLFETLGGFDPLFTPAYYEDVDLCLRMMSVGFDVYYCPSSTVVHLSGATSSEVWDSGNIDRIVEANRARFVDRWGPWLRSRMLGRDVVQQFGDGTL